ncbi:hypothetical protein CJA_3172 [Cellvibrio japonicus Ueda107]|uniref:Uncharacterized protein n=1 Tax=Cellvibrio japonicus (strain Ueda107) TaxID=498211 RepID=B3PDW9_CELJU|nr:hypothetical protein CJA_3172 [Cellvibrio japonicus Ueda107]
MNGYSFAQGSCRSLGQQVRVSLVIRKHAAIGMPNHLRNTGMACEQIYRVAVAAHYKRQPQH